MTLATQIKQDLATFFAAGEFVETIDYRPRDGAEVLNVPALIDLDFDVEIGSLVDTTLIVAIPSTGITGITGIAAPKAGDLALIRTKLCRLIELTTDPDGIHECKFALGAVE